MPTIYANDNDGVWHSDFYSLVSTCLELEGPAGEIARLLYPQADDITILKFKVWVPADCTAAQSDEARKSASAPWATSSSATCAHPPRWAPTCKRPDPLAAPVRLPYHGRKERR